MRKVIDSVTREYERYRRIGDGALGQLEDGELCHAASEGENSAAVIVRHISGNLVSRFTEFFGSDGEKPWRNRDGEFVERAVTRAELAEAWAAGWTALFSALGKLIDEDLDGTVMIRGQPLSVCEALHRSLAHTSYHVGQLVHVAKSRRGKGWRSLSIPPGQSAAYNRSLAR